MISNLLDAKYISLADISSGALTLFDVIVYNGHLSRNSDVSQMIRKHYESKK